MVKLRYRSSPKTADMDAMECNVIACLDDVPLLQIKRRVLNFYGRYIVLIYSSFSSYANRSAHFISAYSQGLSGGEAAWANMVIGPCLQAWLPRSKKHFKVRLYISIYIINLNNRLNNYIPLLI